ncbi:MAG: NAD(P)-binding protein [Clostridia bacterium]|nr:NAD(P)-binding protein [Clostridia bacterium]
MEKWVLLSDVRVPFDADDGTVWEKATEKMKRAGITAPPLLFRLYKKSIDARKRPAILAVCSVLIAYAPSVRLPARALAAAGAREYREPPMQVERGREAAGGRPLVVGMGPAGMFCALLLAENGYAPILIDRGDDVAGRVRAVESFYKTGVLDTRSNIQFGAGGAGTFSDGKLITRVGDEKCGYVLRRFAEFGAPPEITTQARPHIGTDILREVVARLLSHIEVCGGELHYRTCLQEIRRAADGTVVAVTDRGEIPCGALVLAPGHSARDTYAMLLSRGFAIEPKPFSVGVRVEHLQSDIDRILYGELAGHPKLPRGEYSQSDTAGARGVYTFCMCPGGEVMAAASEEGGVVVNGMSRHARDGVNANSAVAVSVFREDYGNTPQGAIEYQRGLERAAFCMGGEDYTAPAQTMGDFLAGKRGTEPSRVMPSYRGGQVRMCDLGALLPPYITENLRRGFLSFDRRMPGYIAPDTVLTGVETRTSAPVRLLRGESLTAVGHDRVYPCGEGAGYAGGITSAAVDGIRVALAIMKRFAPCED